MSLKLRQSKKLKMKIAPSVLCGEWTIGVEAGWAGRRMPTPKIRCLGTVQDLSRTEAPLPGPLSPSPSLYLGEPSRRKVSVGSLSSCSSWEKRCMCQHLEDSSLSLKRAGGVFWTFILTSRNNHSCQHHSPSKLVNLSVPHITNLWNHSTYLIGDLEDKIQYKHVRAE